MKDLIMEYIEQKKKLIEIQKELKDKHDIWFIESPDYIQVYKNIEKIAEIFDMEIQTRDIKNGIEKTIFVENKRILEV